jgi:hypothetical protein
MAVKVTGTRSSSRGVTRRERFLKGADTLPISRLAREMDSDAAGSGSAELRKAVAGSN